MKRTLSIMLIAAMLLSLLSGVAAANSDTLVISAASVTATPDSKAVVTLQVTQNPGFMGICFYPVVTDANGQTLSWGWTTSKKTSDFDFDMNAGSMILLTADENVDGTGTLLTVEFTVAQNVQPGEYTVSFVLYDGECINEDNEMLDVILPSVTVTVVKCQHWHEQNVAGQPATCEQDGYTAGVYCEDCQTYTSGHETIPAKGHKDDNQDGFCDHGCGLEMPTNAGELQLSLNVAPAQTTVGHYVYATVDITYNPGFAAIFFQPVVRDAEGNLVTWEWAMESFCGFFVNDKSGLISLSADADYSGAAQLVQVAFYVDETETPGDFTVSFQPVCKKANGNAVTVVMNDVVVSVKECPHVNTTYDAGKKADCYEAGYTESTFCNDCQSYVVVPQPIPQLTHKDEDGDKFCDHGCGYQWPENLKAVVLSAQSAAGLTDRWVAVTVQMTYNPGFSYLAIAPVVTDANGNVVSWQWKIDTSKNQLNAAISASAYEIAVAAENCTNIGVMMDVLFLIDKDAAAGDYTVTFATNASENVDGVELTVETPEVTVTAIAHRTEARAEVPATCLQVGYTAGVYCYDCQGWHEGHEEIPANGHTTIVNPAVAPTCDTAGHTQGTICRVCGIVVDAGQFMPALGHTLEIEEGVAATCTEPGKTEGRTCTRCGQVLAVQTDVPALGHQYVNVVTRPTCEAGGYTTHTCSVCGHSYKDSQTAIRAHKWDDGELVRVPTCTGLGTKKMYCVYDDCDAFTFDNLIAPLGHNEKVIPAVAATCTLSGKTEGKYCSSCGEILVAQETVAATGHSFGQWTVTKEATTKEAGVETRTCACGETETREIPMLVVVDEGVNPVVIVVIVVVVLAAAAVVVFVAMKKKRA